MKKNIFEDYSIQEMTCHSGGAIGADSYWELMCESYLINIRAYSYKTKGHKSIHKVEITKEDYKEGEEKVKKANKTLGRKNIEKYMNLLARDWMQVKYAKEIFAIGNIVKEGDTSKSGFSVKSTSVDGGTGYAVQMAINEGKTVYVFDQKTESWYKWSYIIDTFLKLKTTPYIQSKDFAGIGTRELSQAGKTAIENVFLETFEKN